MPSNILLESFIHFFLEFLKCTCEDSFDNAEGVSIPNDIFFLEFLPWCFLAVFREFRNEPSRRKFPQWAEDGRVEYCSSQF